MLATLDANHIVSEEGRFGLWIFFVEGFHGLGHVPRQFRLGVRHDG